VNEIKAMGQKAIALTFDVSKEDEVKSMVEKTVAELGRLDVVNHAASDPAVPRADLISLIICVDDCECRSGWRVFGGYGWSVSQSLVAFFFSLSSLIISRCGEVGIPLGNQHTWIVALLQVRCKTNGYTRLRWSDYW
jgi:hypothetical protein